MLYAGRVAERGPVGPVFTAPRHPYTAGLLAAVPSIDDVAERLYAIPGTPPSLGARPPGCAFAPRCDFAVPLCRMSEPALLRFGSAVVACHRAEELSLGDLPRKEA